MKVVSTTMKKQYHSVNVIQMMVTNTKTKKEKLNSIFAPSIGILTPVVADNAE
jgi:hypothetical protein